MKNTEKPSRGVIKGEVARELNSFDIEESRKKEKLFDALKELIASCGSPEEFFSVGRFESNKFEEIILALRLHALDALKKRDPSEAVEIGRQVLEISGVSAARNVSTQSPNGAIALAEAINWGAKNFSYSFYSLKPAMIVAASETEGVFFGYGEGDAYYLGSPGIGVASFHDPDDEVGYIITEVLKKNIPEWEYPWSGISRQEDSFKILESLVSGNELVGRYADLTLPEDIRKARRKYMGDNFNSRLVALGDMLKKIQFLQKGTK